MVSEFERRTIFGIISDLMYRAGATMTSAVGDLHKEVESYQTLMVPGAVQQTSRFGEPRSRRYAARVSNVLSATMTKDRCESDPDAEHTFGILTILLYVTGAKWLQYNTRLKCFIGRSRVRNGILYEKHAT
jgi:hypothetical protein